MERLPKRAAMTAVFMGVITMISGDAPRDHVTMCVIGVCLIMYLACQTLSDITGKK